MLRRPGAAPGIRITEARFSFMSASHTLDISAPRVRWATRCGFFLAGFGLSVWAPLIPYVRERIPMSDATFGLLLLCVGAGSLSCMPLSGMLAARLGIRLASLGSLALLICALAIMALTDSIAWLGVALFAFGGTLGVLDILLNIQSLKVERALQRPLMSQFHGMFSLGTIAGAACLTALLTLGLSPALSTLLLVGLILVTTLAIRSGLLPDRAPAGGVMFARPTGVVLVVGLLCFVVYLAEGAILDWSAIYLTQETGMAMSLAGLGYASFAALVAIARLSGGPVVARLGTVRVVVIGSVLAATGLLLSLLASHWIVALIGYALCGLGCANISPVLISSLNHQKDMPVHLAVTAATTVGFAGVLAGPALMGFVAHHSSLTIAFAMVAALLLGMLFSTTRLPR